MPAPAPWHMLTAYNVFKHERAFALTRFKSDKQVHCYMGCRIAQDANFQTAQWAGWKKEDKDINDCSGNTHFEIMDYQVTVVGAHYGAASSHQDSCVASCDQPFPPSMKLPILNPYFDIWSRARELPEIRKPLIWAYSWAIPQSKQSTPSLTFATTHRSSKWEQARDIGRGSSGKPESRSPASTHAPKPLLIGIQSTAEPLRARPLTPCSEVRPSCWYGHPSPKMGNPAWHLRP